MTRFVIYPSHHFVGEITIPGDKSISHRSIMFGSLANGVSTITGFLRGEDTLNTLKAFQQMGVNINDTGENIIIEGVGLNGLSKSKKALDMGNSGTAMRLMCGVLAAQSFPSILCGDASLTKRPMQRIIKPLEQMGANIGAESGKPPLTINPVQSLKGISYTLPIASAQVKSAVLLAGLYAEGETTVIETKPSRDHTENMLQRFGYPLERKGGKITLKKGGSLNACDINVPADISSSAFFMVGASICAKAHIVLKNVNINPTRTGVIAILKQMGAAINLHNQQEIGGELVADITVKSAELHGIDIPEALVPLAIDEFPIIFIAAACAKGKTTLRGAEELRVKESDRIQVMADGLNALGIDNQVLADGIVITGGAFKKQNGTIDSHDDHRISMAFAMAGLASEQTITIDGCDNVATSFPNFVHCVAKAGLMIKEV